MVRVRCWRTMADPERAGVEDVISGTGLDINPIVGVASVDAPSEQGTVYSTGSLEPRTDRTDP